MDGTCNDNKNDDLDDYRRRPNRARRLRRRCRLEHRLRRVRWGSLAGRYVGEMPDIGMTMEVDFRKDGVAVLTFVEGGQGTDMDCTYQSGESRIALSCFGSSGISLTRLNGGDLEGDLDGTIVRLKKR